MNKPTIEQELLGTTKKQRKNAAFIRAAMDSIKSQTAAGTFDQALRTTSATNKETFFMKLKRLPRFALVGLAAVGIASVSGTTYAAYRLWTSPSADVNGNVISLQDCRQAGDRTVVYTDAMSGANPEQTAQILKAHCEIGNVQQWAMSNLRAQPGDVMLPYAITAIDGNKMTIVGEDDAMLKISLDETTAFIVDGKLAAASQIKTGDTIAYIAESKKHVKFVIKLSLPIDYYRTKTQNLVITQDDCIGNPAELCRQGGGITGVRVDMNGELASSKLADNWEFKTIEGKVVEFTDDTVTIEGSSGAQYRVSTSRKMIAQFNADTNRNAGMPIAQGDMVGVQYRQPKHADIHMIEADQFEQMTLLVIGDVKAGTLRKY